MIAKVPTIKAHNIWLTTGDEMADVHRYLEQSGQFGKIVVTV
jgi:hypothetical protein